jgi:hypothetical protein
MSVIKAMKGAMERQNRSSQFQMTKGYSTDSETKRMHKILVDAKCLPEEFHT